MKTRRLISLIVGVLCLGLVVTGFVLLGRGFRTATASPPPEFQRRPPPAHNAPPGGPLNPDEQPRRFEREILQRLEPDERRRAIRFWHGLAPRERRVLYDEVIELEDEARLERVRELIADVPLGPPPMLWSLLLIVIGSAGGAVVLFLHLLRREGRRKTAVCPHCARPVERDWFFCPYCTKRLGTGEDD